MPVDDPNSAALSQQSSSELSPNAREFVPKTNEPKLAARSESNNHSRRPKETGAMPKRYSHQANDSSRRNVPRNLPSRLQRNDQYGPEPSHESKKEVPQSPSTENKKIFKDNQSYSHRNGSARNNHYSDRRNDNYRPQQRSQDYDNYNNDYYGSNGASSSTRFYDDRRERKEVLKPSQRDFNSKSNGARKDPQPSHHRQPTKARIVKENSVEPSKISQREQLIKDIEANTLECMICCDKIRDHQPTWSCTNCYHILHLNCIRTWISNSKSETGDWRCVACQFARQETPRDYVCFCGKQKYPQVNRNDLAHSCGEQCGRTDHCQHPCSLRCHPGPHIICQSFVERTCGCGKSTKTFQCSMKETFECDAICEKVLSCGVHTCQQKCHQGACGFCSELVEMKCFCGKESKSETCSAENVFITKYSCDKICDLPLTCNNHRCALVCHPEICGGCSLSPELIKACPCGRTKIDEDQRKSCADPIPLCKSQCSKVLRCGPLAAPHVCTKPCHLNECPPCTKSTSVKCRCGRIEEKIACKDLNSDVRCKKKCTKFRTCGKHKCNQTCCIDVEHVCTQTCGRMLECHKHRCQRPCHIGNCTQCPRVSFDELRCHCGTAVVYPPVPCGTMVPECSKKCTRIHKCSHPVNHQCHSENDCTPCVFLTTKYCYGKHEQRKTIPCNQDSFSCGMHCGKDLKCGRHSCIKKCHQGVCEKPTDVCKQLCTIKRSDCEHNCNVPCHDGGCPAEKSCRVQVEVTCPCGNLKEMRSCEQVEYENRKIQRVKLAVQMQQMQDGDSVEMKDICGDVSKKTNKILECNYDCATLERNRRLDIAFKVENPNLISYPKFMPNYTDFVRVFYKKDSATFNMVYEKLTELVKLAKESKQKSRSYSFPVMNREKRHVVHDLAAMFGVETQAYDDEPNRNVVATASKESCWLPSMSLAEVIAKENGQQIRRPPSMQLKK